MNKSVRAAPTRRCRVRKPRPSALRRREVTASAMPMAESGEVENNLLEIGKAEVERDSDGEVHTLVVNKQHFEHSQS